MRQIKSCYQRFPNVLIILDMSSLLGASQMPCSIGAASLLKVEHDLCHHRNGHCVHCGLLLQRLQAAGFRCASRH